MSLCYNPTAKIKPHCGNQYDDGGWDVNVSGAEILGGLHLQLNLPISPMRSADDVPRVPYSMDRVTALATAKQLSEIRDEAIKATFEKYSYCWVEGPDAVEDYLIWVRNWQKFLEVCGGYDTD